MTGRVRRAHTVCGAESREGSEQEAVGAGRGAHRLGSSCLRMATRWGSEGIGGGGVGGASQCKESKSVKQVF